MCQQCGNFKPVRTCHCSNITDKRFFPWQQDKRVIIMTVWLHETWMENYSNRNVCSNIFCFLLALSKVKILYYRILQLFEMLPPLTMPTKTRASLKYGILFGGR